MVFKEITLAYEGNTLNTDTVITTIPTGTGSYPGNYCWHAFFISNGFDEFVDPYMAKTLGTNVAAETYVDITFTTD